MEDLKNENNSESELNVHKPVVENIVFGDGNGGEFFRISKQDGVVINRSMYPDWQPDNFAEKFLEIIERNFDVRFVKKGSI